MTRFLPSPPPPVYRPPTEMYPPYPEKFYASNGSIKSVSSVASAQWAHSSKSSSSRSPYLPTTVPNNSYADSSQNSPASQYSSLSTASSSTVYSINSWGSTPTVIQPSLPSVLHPALECTHPSFVFRVTSYSDLPRFGQVLQSPATHPPVHSLNIAIDCLPVYLTVRGGSQGVTLQDVAQSLVAFFGTQLQGEEYNALPSDLQRVAAQAFNTRTTGSDKRNGMIRADILGRAVHFAGLAPIQHHPGAFKALLRP